MTTPAPSGPPYAPGTSPFHVKGGIYSGTIKFFNEKVEGGAEQLFREIRDPQLNAFIQQKFLPSSWYDVLPCAPLIRAEARILGMSVTGYLKHRAAYQAAQDLSGVYRLLLKLVSPTMVAERLPRLVGQIFDFGTTESTVESPRHHLLRMNGLPSVLYEWVSTAFVVYAETTLKAAGARACKVALRAPIPDGEAHGVPLSAVVLDAEWT
jgi:hypothetical protein